MDNCLQSKNPDIEWNSLSFCPSKRIRRHSKCFLNMQMNPTDMMLNKRHSDNSQRTFRAQETHDQYSPTEFTHNGLPLTKECWYPINCWMGKSFSLNPMNYSDWIIVTHSKTQLQLEKKPTVAEGVIESICHLLVFKCTSLSPLAIYSVSYCPPCGLLHHLLSASVSPTEEVV